MKSLIDKNFLPLEEEGRESLLLTEGLEKEIEITIAEGQEKKLVLVDLAPTSYESHIVIRLGKRARVEFDIASLLLKDQSKKLIVDVYHEGAESFSRVRFVGIDFSKKDFVFRGSSYIPNGVHKADTRQEGRIMNLAPDCHSEVSPALYIKDNDVKASHGAALGAYDENVLYYLTSRGIGLSEAKRLVTYGYLLPILEKLSDKEVQEKAKKTLEGFAL